jgi:hypothetical protein
MLLFLMGVGFLELVFLFVLLFGFGLFISWLIPLNQCGLRLSEAKECILEKAAF